MGRQGDGESGGRRLDALVNGRSGRLRKLEAYGTFLPHLCSSVAG